MQICKWYPDVITDIITDVITDIINDIINDIIIIIITFSPILETDAAEEKKQKEKTFPQHFYTHKVHCSETPMADLV